MKINTNNCAIVAGLEQCEVNITGKATTDTGTRK